MNKRVHTALQKRAGAVSDALLSAPSALLLGPRINGVLQSIGGVSGEFSIANAKKEELLSKLQNMQRNEAGALIPGVSGYRMSARRAMAQKLLEDAKDKDKSSGATRGLMNYLSYLNPLNVLAAPVAALGAAITPTEKLKDTADTVNDDNYALKSFFLPGWNTYNKFKAIGVSNKLAKGDYTEEEAKELDSETAQLLLARLRERRNFNKKDE